MKIPNIDGDRFFDNALKAVAATLNPSGKCQAAESYVSKKTGRVQFSPVCSNKWKPGVCTLKGNSGACQQCQHKKPAYVDESIIRRHMNGKSRFGIYPALPDNMVHFVVADIDGHQPGQDANADTKTIIRVSSDMSIPIMVFSSNSGTGFHCYLFLSQPTEYSKAAGIMSTILDRCPGLSALDCVKPSRGTDGGTGGGLIALPFHMAAFDARRATVPVDNELNPVAETFDGCIEYFQSEYDPITPTRVDEIIREFGIDVSEKSNADPVDDQTLSGMKNQLTPCIQHILSKNPKTEKTNFNKLAMTVIKYLQGSGYSLDKALSVCNGFLNSYPHSGTYTTAQARIDHFKELWRYLYGRADSHFSCSFVLGMKFSGSAFECRECPLNRRKKSEPEAEKKPAMQPLTPNDTNVFKNLTVEPAPATFILCCRGIPFLRKGIVSLLISSGGLGKTYLMLCLANSLSSGNKWGCFEPEQSYRVLYIGAEDDSDELNRRLWHIGNGDFPKQLHAVSMSGKIGSLMKLDGENPIRNDWFDWLHETIKAHMPMDILFLDPLSRVYGLIENKNEHATAFVSTLESLSIEFGINIVLSHHANKDAANQTKAKQGMSRGASGFIDGVRFAMALTEVNADDASNYGLENPEHFFKLDTIKSNGSAKLTAPLVFKKNPETGVPEYTPISMVRIETLAKGFLTAFAEYGNPTTERDLKKGLPPELFDKIKGNISQINISKDMKPILSYLVEHGFLIETKPGGRGRKSPIYSVNLENVEI